MGLDRDVGLAVAATAAVLSPRARDTLRKGVVYGVAGALKAGDVAASTVRGAARGVQGGAGGDGRAPKSGQQTRRATKSAPKRGAAA